MPAWTAEAVRKAMPTPLAAAATAVPTGSNQPDLPGEEFRTTTLESAGEEIPDPVLKCDRAAGITFAEFYQSYQYLLGCPTSDQITVNTISEQIFEGGHLFWRKDTDIVYIIYDRVKGGGETYHGGWDKSIDPATGRYWSWARANEPDPDGIGLVAPSGIQEPIRGFGWLWRTYLGRETGPLGWALD